MRNIVMAASLGLGGAAMSSMLLVAGQTAVYPKSLAGMVPPLAVSIALVSVASSYILGVSSYAYVLYEALSRWNRAIDDMISGLERIAGMLREAGDPGYGSLEAGRLAYLASNKRVDPLLWSLSSLPPIVGLFSLIKVSGIMDSAMVLRRELALTASSMLRRMGSEKRPSYSEPPPKPLGAFLASILGYPVSLILARLMESVEMLEKFREEALGLVEEEVRGMLIGGAEHRDEGEEA